MPSHSPGRVTSDIVTFVESILSGVDSLPCSQAVVPRFINEEFSCLWDFARHHAELDDGLALTYGVKASAWYQLMIVLHWSNEYPSLATAYPDTTPSEAVPAYEILTKYCVALSDSNFKQLFMVDSAPHHTNEVPETYPHHRHEFSRRRGTTERKDPGPFDGGISTLASYLADYIE